MLTHGAVRRTLEQSSLLAPIVSHQVSNVSSVLLSSGSGWKNEQGTKNRVQRTGQKEQGTNNPMHDPDLILGRCQNHPRQPRGLNPATSESEIKSRSAVRLRLAGGACPVAAHWQW